MDVPSKGEFDRLRAFCLAFPEAGEEFPWGESAFKVKGKTFVFSHNGAAGISLSVKLPRSREFALEYPFTKPTGYGLGKSGWVTASFRPGESPPFDILEAWIGESYCAVAPKKLAASAAKNPIPPAKESR